MSDSIRAGGRSVPITNPNKVLFPEDGITKRELIEYHAAIAPLMLPHLRKRPLTMERYPDGIAGERIMQKNIAKYFPDWIPRASVPKKDGTVTHVLANDAATLVYLAQQASITQHLWLSTIDRPAEPDVMIIDLDPTTDDFTEVRKAALLFRSLLIDVGLVPFVKATGSRGLHVVAPLRAGQSFEVVYRVASGLAHRAAEEKPDLLTTEFYKAKRGQRIFLDVNRNAYAQTAVAAYSVRARKAAPVAAPLDWKEVEDRRLRPDGFSMRDALERPDHWKGFRSAARGLRSAMKDLGIEL